MADGKWIAWGEQEPPANDPIDILYTGDRREPHIWMLCLVFKDDGETFAGTPTFWRHAIPLPEGVEYYGG